MGMRQTLAYLTLALALSTAPAVAGAEEKSFGKELDEKIGEIDRQLEAAMSALERFVADIPMYERPEITPDGDIIIRKRREPPKAFKPPASGAAGERKI